MVPLLSTYKADSNLTSECWRDRVFYATYERIHKTTLRNRLMTPTRERKETETRLALADIDDKLVRDVPNTREHSHHTPGPNGTELTESEFWLDLSPVRGRIEVNPLKPDHWRSQGVLCSKLTFLLTFVTFPPKKFSYTLVKMFTVEEGNVHRWRRKSEKR